MSGKCLKTFFLFALFLLWHVGPVAAAVKGPCSNCHTMHNSQDDSLVSVQSNVKLTITDCVGCHSSAGPDTIVTLGESRIPIVYNTTGYPAQPLAGGNFYHVAQGGAANDMYGHNVYGISGQDNNLASAPGKIGIGCGLGCHVSLAQSKEEMSWASVDGCMICHQYFKHHGSSVAAGEFQTADSGWYRFLGAHAGRFEGGIVYPTHYVNGIEDPDWEQNPAAGHNRYLEQVRPPDTKMELKIYHSVTTFCNGCHGDYHAYWSIEDATNGWIRHPTSIVLPTTGEYAAYDPAANYDATVPVGWVNPAAPIRSEAVVMCLSCHRVHGSEYPDMLRWDYSTMVANAGDSNEGCFKCHSTKDA